MSTVERLTGIAPRAVAAALSGLVMVLICPPIGLTWLQWFAYVPLLWALRADEHRTNAKLGYWFGWCMLFANFFWLADTVVIFSSLPYALRIPEGTSPIKVGGSFVKSCYEIPAKSFHLNP